MEPRYFPEVFDSTTLDDMMSSTPWIQVTDARLECFMSVSDKTYTYGSGLGVRTYTPVPYSDVTRNIQRQLNFAVFRSDMFGRYPDEVELRYNVCFLNRYDNAKMQLGWHSDDSPGMDHEHPIAVVSFGQPREIWWREIGYKGVVPKEQRQLLEHGSVFVMPPGFQRLYQHRIPKGDREMGTRVSLTFRHYVP